MCEQYNRMSRIGERKLPGCRTRSPIHPYIPRGPHAAIVFIVPVVIGLWLHEKQAKKGSKLFTN